MQPPPSGAQMPQLSLQQYSPAPQKLAPHGSPEGGSGGQYSSVQPGRDRRTDCSSHCSSTLRDRRSTWLHGSLTQRSSEQGCPWEYRFRHIAGNRSCPRCRGSPRRGCSRSGGRCRSSPRRRCGIATVARIVDALESVRARKPGDPAAHAARSRDLRGAPRWNVSAANAPVSPASTPRRERDLARSSSTDRTVRCPSSPLRIVAARVAACFPPCQRGRRGSVPGQARVASADRSISGRRSSRLLSRIYVTLDAACYTAVAVRSGKCPCRYRRYPAAGSGRGKT